MNQHGTVRALTVFVLAGCFFAGAAIGPTAFAQRRGGKKAEAVPTIAFITSQHDARLVPPAWLDNAEIYLMNTDGTNLRRVSQNATGEGFPSLSPNGRRLVFESNRLRKPGDPTNVFSLFVMNSDGTGEAALLPGNSATWSSDSRSIAYHASSSGGVTRISGLPGAAAIDSDIFTLNVDDFLRRRSAAKNITNSPDAVDDDPDWSPDGKKIVYTSHAVKDDQSNPVTAEIYVVDARGKGRPIRLTNNSEEERAPDWSPDGKRIVYSCRQGEPQTGRTFRSFEICIMNADGSNQRRITNNNVAELTVAWSADGEKLVFHRAVGGPGQFQIFTINPDGTGEKQITFSPGFSGFANTGWAVK